MSALSNLSKVTDYKVEQNDDLIPIIKQQEKLAIFSSFTGEKAYAIGSAIRQEYITRHPDYLAEGTGLVIAIELFSGHRAFSVGVGESPVIGPDNWGWVQGKLNVVRKYGKSSLRAAREFAQKDRSPASLGLSLPEYAFAGGGFPIFIKGVTTGPIGAIVVSGLPQLEDHQLIVDTLASNPSLLD